MESNYIHIKLYVITRSCPIFYAVLTTVYPKKYAHGFCFAVLCCGYTLTDFPISIRLTSLALWQSNDCPSASKATLMNMDKYFMWIHYERLHNHNKAKHNKTVCIFLGIYCSPLYIKARMSIYTSQKGAFTHPCPTIGSIILLTHWSRDGMDISQTFSIVSFSMKKKKNFD